MIGYKAIGEAANGKDAIKLAMSLRPDIITLDNVLPDMFGVEVLQKLKKDELEAEIVMVSAVGNEKIVTKVKGMGAAGYIVKPFESDELIRVVNNINHGAITAA